jgi:hypothetical protein
VSAVHSWFNKRKIQYKHGDPSLVDPGVRSLPWPLEGTSRVRRGYVEGTSRARRGHVEGTSGVGRG